jgi:hypothetical protein
MDRQRRGRRLRKRSLTEVEAGAICYLTGIACYRRATGGHSDVLLKDWEVDLLLDTLTHLEENTPE